MSAMEEGEEGAVSPRSRKRERSPDRASDDGEDNEVSLDPGRKKRRKGVMYRD